MRIEKRKYFTKHLILHFMVFYYLLNLHTTCPKKKVTVVIAKFVKCVFEDFPVTQNGINLSRFSVRGFSNRDVAHYQLGLAVSFP